jgi:hypothetical protein
MLTNQLPANTTNLANFFVTRSVSVEVAIFLIPIDQPCENTLDSTPFSVTRSVSEGLQSFAPPSCENSFHPMIFPVSSAISTRIAQRQKALARGFNRLRLNHAKTHFTLWFFQFPQQFQRESRNVKKASATGLRPFDACISCNITQPYTL